MLIKSGGFLLRVVTWATAFATVVGGWGAYADPGRFWPVAIMTLVFQYVLPINILFLILWSFRKRRMLLIPLAAVLIVLVRIPLVFHPSGKTESLPDDNGTIRLMSFNVRLFDFYNWTNNHQTRQEILSFLREHPQDIYCFQEFFTSKRMDYDNIKPIMALPGIGYNHHHYTIKKLYGTDDFGLATFSRYPIVNRGMVDLQTGSRSTNQCIFSDLLVGRDTLRIYNFHLQSIRLDEVQYRLLEGADAEELSAKQKLLRSATIIKRLRRGWQRRAEQSRLIADHVKQSPYPVILAGDLNDNPLSYAYQTLTGGLKDAFMESGSGFGFTYAGPIPGLRIDAVFHSPQIGSSDFSIYYKKYSDHYPQSARFRIKK